MTHMTGEDSDEQLLERYAQGDSQAFEAFFVRHKSRVYHYALGKLRRSEIAAEMTQDVFLKLHSKIHLYRQGERALPWFFSIVHNSCIDELRRQTVAFKVLDSSSAAELVAANAAAESVDGKGSLSTAIGDAMQGLSADQRRVLELRVTEGKTFRQISAETGKSEVALRKLYSRAVETLRAWFSEQDRKEGRE
jgi:RNA polymerase sigma-70 factor (ECF subfamily)